MASEEHKYLADVIKRTHATLREEARNYGPAIAWKRHVSRKDILQKYAISMQKLATAYWVENNINEKSSTYSRIEWIKSQCEEYFLNGGKQKFDKREQDIKSKIDTSFVEINVDVNHDLNVQHEKKISLLDVGSCFNPFSTLNMFQATAIDLNGIPGKVLCCDFLNVKIGKQTIFSDDKAEVLQLSENSFNTVVFSLFLEYLPCPKQRFICCKKAYDVLQTSGVLFIISPDSKHVNANAKIMKSWRYVLSKLGLMRIKYEKLRHMHCVVYRKCVFKDVATRWADLQKLSKNDPLYSDEISIYIPQDFQNISNERVQGTEEENDPNEIICMFNELPFKQM